MQFWDWFLTLLLGARPARSASPGRNSASRPARASATAVLDRPEEAETVEAPWWEPSEPFLTELQPPPQPQFSPIAEALERVLQTQVAAEDMKLPPLPRGVERVLLALDRALSDAQQIGDLIGEDPVRAATVLRTANSALYGGTERITQLPLAVARIGNAVLRSLLMRESLRGATVGLRGADRQLARRIWERALAAAHIMRGLARFTGVNPEEASVIGLLCDVGMVGVLREAAEQSTALRTHVNAQEFEYLCHVSHEFFGRHIAAAWRLPPDLQALIADHHTPPAEDDPLARQRHMIQLTEMILALLDYAAPAPYRLLSAPAAQALRLHDSPELRRFLEELPDELEQAVAD